MQKLLDRLLPMDELIATVRRFPLSVACAVVMFILSLFIVHEVFKPNDHSILRVYAILGCCYFWFGLTKLYQESQGWSTSRNITFSLIGAVAFTLLFGIAYLWWLHLLLVIPALLLGLMFAPYLTSGDDTSFWFFNRLIWFGVAVSYLSIFMFAGGLSLGLGAINLLFSIKIDDIIYSDIWLFASLVLGPVYALSWVPKNFEFTEEDCKDPVGLSFVANWISVPMVLVYLLILYAYFIKILMTGEVPNGMLAWIISGFAGAGIVTYLIAWPMRESGSPQLKLFYKIFFPALIIPVGFHFYAIWERIMSYGLTEQRYVILISALWFLTLAISNTLSKAPIKFIPASLCVLIALASFGPWGAVGVSGASQFSRLEKLLNKHDLLEEGQIQKAQSEISFEDRLSISSILDYLCRSGRDSYLEEWFNIGEKKTDSWSCSSGRKLTKDLGFDYISHYNRSRFQEQQLTERFYINPKRSKFVDIADYDVTVSAIYVHRPRNEDNKPSKVQYPKDKNTEKILSVLFDGNRLEFDFTAGQYFTLNAMDFIKDRSLQNDNNEPLIVLGENDEISYRLIVRSLNGQVEDGVPQIQRMNFDLYYRIKK